MPGSENGEPAGRCWLISRFSPAVAKAAAMDPTTMNGLVTSRKATTAVVWASTTSHLDAAFATKTTAGTLRGGVEDPATGAGERRAPRSNLCLF